MNEEINFFTVATGKYKIFVLPYIVSVLSDNTISFVEIVTDDLSYFEPMVFNTLDKHFKDRYLIREIDKELVPWLYEPQISGNIRYLPATIRFLGIPNKKCKYTYIGDIDILVLDDIETIIREHVNYANLLEKPYSNVIRKNEDKLSGLHFVVTEEYYSKVNVSYIRAMIEAINHKIVKVTDEEVLYIICESLFGLPNASVKYFRPLHGVHFSLNRELVFSTTELAWTSTPYIPYIQKVHNLTIQEPWQELEEYFDKLYVDLLIKYEKACKDQGIDVPILGNKKTLHKEYKIKTKDTTMSFLNHDLLINRIGWNNMELTKDFNCPKAFVLKVEYTATVHVDKLAIHLLLKTKDSKSFLWKNIDFVSSENLLFIYSWDFVSVNNARLSDVNSMILRGRRKDLYAKLKIINIDLGIIHQ